MTVKLIHQTRNEAPINRPQRLNNNLNINSSLSPHINYEKYTNEAAFFYSGLSSAFRQNATNILNLTNSTLSMTLITSTIKAQNTSSLPALVSNSSSTKTTRVFQTYPRFFSPPKHQAVSDSEDVKDTLGLYTSEELISNYNPEIGFRIALALGSMIVILIFYLIWENTCSSSRNLNLDMEFWLNYVDRKNTQKQRRADKARYSFDSMISLRLPENSANEDSYQATANWVLEHSYLTEELPKIPNKYYLCELSTRRHDNFTNRELLLFEEKIQFNQTQELLSTNDIKSTNRGENQKSKTAWYQNPYRPKHRKFEIGEFLKKNQQAVNEYGSVVKRKKQQSRYHRRSWPISDKDYIQLYNRRYMHGRSKRGASYIGVGDLVLLKSRKKSFSDSQDVVIRV